MKEVEQWVRSELENTELCREDSEKRGQPGIQETGSEVQHHLKEGLWRDKRADKNNVNHIGHRSSGGEELE